MRWKINYRATSLLDGNTADDTYTKMENEKRKENRHEGMDLQTWEHRTKELWKKLESIEKLESRNFEKLRARILKIQCNWRSQKYPQAPKGSPERNGTPI